MPVGTGAENSDKSAYRCFWHGGVIAQAVKRGAETPIVEPFLLALLKSAGDGRWISCALTNRSRNCPLAASW